MSAGIDLGQVLECAGCEDPEQHPHAFDCTRNDSPLDRVRTWETLEEYIEEFPDATHLWSTLRYGHEINRGHPWQGRLFLSVDGIIWFERKCC